ncbi:MAG: pyridoxal-phosphate dependent enzyme [Pseudomonadota bacterium]|nr:pyridoxal-phosphate dependent enzyme [Pseudomonadota bacterium]
MNKPLHSWTPTFDSLPLRQKSGQRVWLKMECFQPCGSFKIRGLGRLAQYYIEQGFDQFVSSSGGNAGLAAAYIGRKLGYKVTVFLPTTSKPIYRNALKLEGAEVKVVGDVWDDANASALEFMETQQAAFLPPFDHPLIWQGHASMIDEIVAENIKPDAVVVAVGGGGLACGVLTGMRQNGWQDVPLFGVETLGSASFAASLHADKLVTLDKITTIATSLGAKRITQALLDFAHQHPVRSIVVSDNEALSAARAFADDHRVLIEPSSGAALAPIYQQHPALKQFKSVLVVVCGGVGISIDLFDEYAQAIKTV